MRDGLVAPTSSEWPMSGPQIKGWCPGALRPMLSGDGWLVRVRPGAGRLTQSQAAGIAMLATRHGNGLIDMTSRANLQLRGVRPDSHLALIDGLRALNLLDSDAVAEARRNLVVTPFWAACDDTLEIARALADALTASDAPALPGKFGFAVDCGQSAVLRSTAADIRIERGPCGLIVRADGHATGAQVTALEAVPAAMELAGWFAAGDGLTHERLRRSTSKPRLPARFERALGLPPSAAPARVGAVACGWLAGVEFGQLRADTLAELAKLGPLRITPWRMVLIEGVSAAPELAGLIADADDPLLRVVACSGAPGCLQGLAATRPLARALAAHVAPGKMLHVSGCTKGCACLSDTLTVVATPAGFDLVRHGRAFSTPDLRAVQPEAIAFHLKPSAHAAPL
jgi:precorrin-3B synthase